MTSSTFSLFSASILVALLTAACGGGGSQSTGGAGGTSATGGAGGGPPLCGQEASACCEQDPTDPCCTPCAQPCGGIAGLPCAADEFCDFPDDQCGAADGAGTCRPRPTMCSVVGQPTCGCDGQIHMTDCDGQAAGADVSILGGCVTPMAMFACGPYFCPSDLGYCRKTLSDVGGTPDSYTCEALPAGCPDPKDCACLAANVACGSTCAHTPEGGAIVTCPGG